MSQTKNKTAFLLLNATGHNSAICLVYANDKYCRTIIDNQKKSQSILETAASLIGRHRLSLSDLAGIGVVVGPGSFTSTKVGITIANALAWSTDQLSVGLTLDQFQLSYRSLARLVKVDRVKIIKPRLSQPSISGRLV